MKSNTRKAKYPQEIFGSIIRRRRTELGLTQSDLEGDEHLERSYISKIEAGKFQVCLNGILQLANALEVSSAELMEELELQLKKKK